MVLSIIIGGFALNESLGLLSFMALSLGVFFQLVVHTHDIRDMEGDKREGCYTLPVLLGRKIPIIFAAVGYVILFVFPLLGVFHFNFNFFFPVVMLFFSFIGLRKLVKVWSSESAAKEFVEVRIMNRISTIVFALLFSLALL
ncbi:hypothetical protein AKJ49_02175 [candidate division MSBL1 archaeon SCGC-AAA382A03]|uniref:1,4-dihydroxy-2-naphthoate octaprenyltransferase n=1 Tax=candidate division MSBL1 archaeon SCGC-AAA382A03 TaxID=1698278 RepID=A0A133VD57_9EURY|nr:hypothetical protein AKJ49_02175 [candidate division MSBL1 archaeon SCGC-AAA382A03]